MAYILELFQFRVARNNAAASHKGTIKEKIERFASRHALAKYVFAFVGIPVLILAALFICLAVITLPMALLLGWV
ncbi:hypothetical protein H8693_02300 [Christensenellaceae bacterium NSJ-63]|uniref:Uncharacterized protein n=1 Tax=Guopingia tenuis TaxID=2763656 RepID=A0A926DGL7_9FIRM|nr:hypothetical protein [Guopingia tenuis]MBC8537763.1 hypothetical protein [Guopingia tenuis]